jgi:AcrR family transcriptional regulator
MNKNESPTPRKRKKGLETTDRILRASAELFAANGFDAVSLTQIAEASGMRESSLYNHFSGKNAILESLFEIFRSSAPLFRPSPEELDRLLPHMTPEEIMKHILLYFGSHGDDFVERIAMVITNEKFKNPEAATIYYACIVREPSAYYETLFQKMIARGMIRPIDTRMFAEQYNYVSIALTKEYFMAKNGLADLESVVRYMVKTLRFFCSLMQA